MNAITRRTFLGTAGALSAGALLSSWASAERRSALDKLDIGVIGVANRGSSNLRGVAGENIVALCDIDENYLAGAKERHPGAKTFVDYRKMIDEVKLDAIVVSTADHTHAVATMAALNAGCDVYCEKPLTHTVAEARAVTEEATRRKAVTQMGTQIHAGANYRRVVELIQSGAIGQVTECHAWVGKAWGGGQKPTEEQAVPKHLHYDLWLGPAKSRPYNSAYLPANWRRYWDFGTGTLGDMGCHHMDLLFWALELDSPTHVAASGPKVDAHTAPTSMHAEWRFPKRRGSHGELPEVTMHWWDGGERPPQFAEEGLLPRWGDGTLFVGDKGMLLSDYGRYVLLPASDFAEFEPPAPTIPNSIGHYAEWIEACKTRGTTTCNFRYSGRLTETVLLGTVAYRAGEAFEWNGDKLEVKGSRKAAAMIDKDYREGWSL